MSGHHVGLKPRLQAFLQGIDERTSPCPTNTQFLLQLSGYRWVAEEFGPLSGRHVLDAASGSGFGSETLAREGAAVVGIDLDSQAARRARQRYAGPSFACMDVTSLGFQDETFDLVVSQDTLEHVEDDSCFVREVCRVLRRGGVFVVFTPHATVHTTRPVNPYHLREYSTDSLVELLGRFFPSICLYGRRPAAPVREVEAHLHRVRRLDPLGLRRLLFPSFLRHRVAAWVLRWRGARPLEELSVEEVEYFQGSNGSSTLIAVCRKEVSPTRGAGGRRSVKGSRACVGSPAT